VAHTATTTFKASNYKWKELFQLQNQVGYDRRRDWILVEKPVRRQPSHMKS